MTDIYILRGTTGVWDSYRTWEEEPWGRSRREDENLSKLLVEAR